MNLAVTDANIFIDLIRLRWLDYFFQLPVAVCTTQHVVEQLNDEQLPALQPFIETGHLKLHGFDHTTLLHIEALALPRGLEFADRGVIYLAQTLQARVLTGDNLLRKVCEKQGLEVHGIIWIFDHLVDNEIVPAGTAALKMEELLGFNIRLPAPECESRIKLWRAL
jgi:predicted nucleic acid-binding protein